MRERKIEKYIFKNKEYDIEHEFVEYMGVTGIMIENYILCNYNIPKTVLENFYIDLLSIDDCVDISIIHSEMKHQIRKLKIEKILSN